MFVDNLVGVATGFSQTLPPSLLAANGSPDGGGVWFLNVLTSAPRARRSKSTHDVTSRMGMAIMVLTYLREAAL